jgi:hypothetical protein
MDQSGVANISLVLAMTLGLLVLYTPMYSKKRIHHWFSTQVE